MSSRSSPTASATSQTAASPATATTSFKAGVTYTYYEVNTFHLKFQATGVRLLVDPWLVDELVFFNQAWLYRGKKPSINRTKPVDPKELCDDSDVIVITQGLPDHCHIPTLKLLPRDKPVVAQEQAAAQIRDLGFTNVRSIDHGDTITVCEGKLLIHATKGALVGPPWSKRQLGLVFRESDPALTVRKPEIHHASVYYEPHCDFTESSVKDKEVGGEVDVVISPVRSSLLKLGPFSYPLVRGDIDIDKLLKILNPRVVVPLLNDNIEQQGPIGKMVVGRGDADGLRKRLPGLGVRTRIEMPAPAGEALAIAL